MSSANCRRRSLNIHAEANGRLLIQIGPGLSRYLVSLFHLIARLLDVLPCLQQVRLEPSLPAGGSSSPV